MGNGRRVAILGAALVGLAELLQERGYAISEEAGGLIVSDRIGIDNSLWHGVAVSRYKPNPLEHLDYGTRIHPKLAYCSSRRKGRKCKKAKGRK